VVGPNGFSRLPLQRPRDHPRPFADNSAANLSNWLLAHGVEFVGKAPDAIGGYSVGNSVAARDAQQSSVTGRWPATGRPGRSGGAEDPFFPATA